MTSNKNCSLSIWPFCIIGIIAGAILATILLQPNESPLLVFWFSCFTVILLLAYPKAPSITWLVASSVIASFLIAMPIRYIDFSSGTSAFIIINAIAINAFHLSYQQHRTLFNYPALFNGVWESIIKIAITCGFSLVCHSLLMLWSQLFIVINLSFFQKIFTTTWFLAWSTVFFASIGLYIASKNQIIINKLLNIILTACRLLVPAIAIATLIFIALAVVMQFTAMHQFRAGPTFMFMALISIIVINGLLQSTLTLTPYTKGLQWVVNAFVILLPLFPLTLLYTVIFINENPITIHNIFYNPLFTYNLLLAIYTLCYSVSFAFRQHSWLFTLKMTNIVMGVVLIMLCLSLNNPYTKHQHIRSITQHDEQVKRKPQQNLAKQLQMNHNALKQANFDWGDPQRSDTIIIGYNPTPIFICRSNVSGKYLYGMGDSQSCSLLVNHTIQPTRHFQVLHGPENALQWSNRWGLTLKSRSNDNQAIPVIINQEADKRQEKAGWAGICRAIYHNQIHAGYINLHTSTCILLGKKHTFILNHVNNQDFRILQLQPKKAHAQPPQPSTHVHH